MSKIKIKCFGLTIIIDANNHSLSLKSKGKLSFYEPNLHTASQDFRNTLHKGSLISFVFEHIESRNNSITNILKSDAQNIRDIVKKGNDWGGDSCTTDLEFIEPYIHFRDYFNDGLNDVYTVWYFTKASENVYILIKHSAYGLSEDYVIDIAKFILSNMTIEPER